jgi:hypothetical protein
LAKNKDYSEIYGVFLGKKVTGGSEFGGFIARQEPGYGDSVSFALRRNDGKVLRYIVLDRDSSIIRSG